MSGPGGEFDLYQPGDGPIAPERLREIVDSIYNKLPDHCGFVLIIAQMHPEGEGRAKGCYASNANRQDAILAMMDTVQHLQDPENPHA